MDLLPASIVQTALAAMKVRPCVELYPGDWFRDDVSGTSLRARGFWATAIMVMHDAKPYGHLVGANGMALNRDQILTRFQMRKPSELKAALEELESLGIPGRTGDAAYEKILRTEPATIKLAGVEWTLDLSPLGVTETGTIYSRRMLRDRRLALIRFLASPSGQSLILPLTQPLRQTLSGQKSELCTPVHARAYVEEEEVLGFDSHSQPTKSTEGVQGEPLQPDFDAAARLNAKLDESALRVKPSLQIVVAWLSEFTEELILETLIDCEPAYRGKNYQYLESILTTRRDNPEQRPGNRRAKGNGNGNGTHHGPTLRNGKPRPIDFLDDIT